MTVPPFAHIVQVESLETLQVSWMEHRVFFPLPALCFGQHTTWARGEWCQSLWHIYGRLHRDLPLSSTFQCTAIWNLSILGENLFAKELSDNFLTNLTRIQWWETTFKVMSWHPFQQFHYHALTANKRHNYGVLHFCISSLTRGWLMRTLETHLNQHETSASWNFILTMNISFPFVLLNRLTIMKKLPGCHIYFHTIQVIFFFKPTSTILVSGWSANKFLPQQMEHLWACKEGIAVWVHTHPPTIWTASTYEGHKFCFFPENTIQYYVHLQSMFSDMHKYTN